jgi:cytoskeletal protein CcmA (bactofilin family)
MNPLNPFGQRRTDAPDPVKPPPLNRPTLPPQPNPAPRALNGTAAAAASVIGADLSINGNLQSAGEVQIEGNLEGNLTASRIVVGQNAKINGNLIADDVVVQGTVNGSIRGNRVTLQSSSRVDGDIVHQSLAIEQGAFFEGKSRRSEDPIGSAPKPADIGLLTNGNGSGRNGLYGDTPAS